VIVAAGTADGQPHQAAARDVDPVVDDVLHVVDEPPAQRQEARSRRGGGVPDLVRRDLSDHEPVVRQVFVEGANHPVAIRVSFRVVAVLLEHVALGIGIAGHVQPVPRPTLAEVRRVQELVDDAPVRLVAVVAFKSRRLFGAGRQAGQVVVQPAQQRARGGSGRRIQAALLQRGQDKAVEVAAWPGRVPDLRRRMRNRRQERPVVRRVRRRLGGAGLLSCARIGCAHLDPTHEIPNHRVRQLPVRRHFHRFPADRLNQQTVLRLPRGHYRT